MSPESVSNRSETFPIAGIEPFGCEGMKVKEERLPQSSLSGDEQARFEIRSFLEALQSYPARATKEPGITFEQHLYGLVAPGPATPRPRD
jgi:hypothetical protein